ncbi:MAG: TonB-dependent receptor [Prevotella sp.]|nr:TonB-dependent receptor [Prevotella sp.]
MLPVHLQAQAIVGTGKAAHDTIVSKQDQLPEVTVTENRHRKTQKSITPQFVLERGDLLRMGAVDMADALHRLPGITLRDYGGAGGMKTVSVRGFGAKHTGVSYDGVVLGDCQTGEIDLARYTLDNLAALQLSIGDNDHLFVTARQASTPALLTIDTSTPPLSTDDDSQKTNLTAQVRVGSFGYVSPMFRFEQRLSPNLVLWAAGEYVYADNDYPFRLRNITVVTTERRTNSRMNQGHCELNMRWNIDGQSSLNGKLYYYDNDRQLPGIVHYYTSVCYETLRDRNAFGQMFYQRRWQNGLSMKVTAKVNWAASFYDEGPIASLIQDANYWQREYYVSAAGFYTPDEHWAFNYSADYTYNNLNSTLTTDTRPLRHGFLQTAAARYQNHRLTLTARLLYSVYANDEKRLQNELIEAGAKNENRLSPSLGLSYELMRGLRIRASFKDIFRVPTFNESYYFHYGNRVLNPEKTMQMNLGMTYTRGLNTDYSSGYSFSFDGYYNKVKDMIVAVPHNMFVWHCINVGKVRALGLDVTARWQQPVAKGQLLAATVNYSMQHVQNRTNPESPYYNNQIAYMPVSSGGMSVCWENPWANISIHGEGVSSRWTNNEHLDGTRIAGYWEMGATAWRTFHFGKNTAHGKHHNELTLRFDLKNILDKQYEIVGAYPMPGRSWQLSLTYQL